MGRPAAPWGWLLTIVLAAACGGRGGDDLAYGSGDDVTAILRAAGVEVAALSCANPKLHGQVIRAVACTARLSPQQVATLSTTLPLAPGPARHAPPAHTGSCEATAGFASTSPGVEVLVGANTKVPNGASRVAVHVARATGAACVEIEYPWSE